MRKNKENSEPLIFNLNLKYLREQSQLSALKLSKTLNIAWATYVAYETTTWPRPETLIAISEFFDISIDKLVKVDLRNKENVRSEAVENNSSPADRNRIKDLEAIISAKDELITMQKEMIHELRNKNADAGLLKQNNEVKIEPAEKCSNQLA